MSEWKMDINPLSTALTNTGTAYENLLGVVTEEGLTTIMSSFTWGGILTEPVPIALGELLTEQQEVNLQKIANRVGAGISGVSNSARQLQLGDEDMAGTFQTEMFASAQDGDFSYFEANGYRPE